GYAVLNLFTAQGYLTSPSRGSFRKQKDVQLAKTLDLLRAQLPPFDGKSEAEGVPKRSRG
ncbi:MAG: hypothetical protein ACRD1T_07440, partial [Acidimicrobiia bacterium]